MCLSSVRKKLKILLNGRLYTFDCDKCGSYHDEPMKELVRHFNHCVHVYNCEPSPNPRLKYLALQVWFWFSTVGLIYVVLRGFF